MSIEMLTAGIAGLTAKLDKLHETMGSVTQALPTTAAALKEVIDPVTALNKLFGEDFPQAANFFSESYKVLVERLQRGEITTDQATESLRAMQRILEQFGLKPDQVGGLDAWTRKFEELIRQLTRQTRRP